MIVHKISKILTIIFIDKILFINDNFEAKKFKIFYNYSLDVK